MKLTQRPPKVALLWQLALSRATGHRMLRPSLEGRSILIVEDEPVIAMGARKDARVTDSSTASRCDDTFRSSAARTRHQLAEVRSVVR